MKSIEPFFIYLVGEDHAKRTPSYVCTFLSQLHLYQYYNPHGSYDRVCVFWGKNGNSKSKCRHPKYKHPLEGRSIPSALSVDVLSQDDTTSTFLLRLRQILDKHCIPQWTPILLFYDGHGFLVDKDVAIGSTTDKTIIGDMILTPSVTLSDHFWAEALAPYRDNPKFMLFSQCGSLDMGLRLLPQINNTVILTSTIQPNVCSYGASIFSKFHDLMAICSKNHLISFQDIQLLVTANQLSYLSRGMELKLSYFYPRLSPDIYPFVKSDKELQTLLHSILHMPSIQPLSQILPKREYWGDDQNHRWSLFFAIVGKIIARKKLSCLTQALQEVHSSFKGSTVTF